MPESRVGGERLATSQVQRLLQLAQAGSNEALGEMLEGCRQYLLLVANDRLGSELTAKAGASDIVQDTFASAGAHFSRFSGTTETELLAWLRQILLNHLATLRRRFVQSQKRQVSREVSLAGSDGRAIGPDVVIDKRCDTPSRHALRNERARQLQRAIENLPPRYRQVIQLRHRDHLPFAEVSRRLDLSAPAARQLWARAINKLQESLLAVRF